ncbi:MAG: hypothetical protein ACXW3Z_06830 [Limisphaerales bacterium]
MKKTNQIPKRPNFIPYAGDWNVRGLTRRGLGSLFWVVKPEFEPVMQQRIRKTVGRALTIEKNGPYGGFHAIS